MQPSALAKRLFIILFIVIIGFYFFGLGYLPFIGPDEPRYAQVAREMFLRSDFITPTLGGHTWFEKPALLYWMMIVAYKLFGVSEFSARLGPAVCGVLTILAVWVITKQIEQTRPSEIRGLSLWSAAAIATSLGMIVFSRGASFDVVVTVTITWSLALFFLHELANARSKRLLLAGFYAAMGLSLLAKGLIGVVIPLGVIGFYHLLGRKKPSRELLVSVLWGLPITLLVSALWYGPVIARHGWSFIDEFFIQHHFARYVSDKYQHPQPVYFYIPIVLMLTVPWTVVLIDSLIRLRFSRSATSDSLGHLKLFATSWILFPLLFFSFSGSKLPGYLLPAIPAAAILIGETHHAIEFTRKTEVVHCCHWCSVGGSRGCGCVLREQLRDAVASNKCLYCAADLSCRIVRNTVCPAGYSRPSRWSHSARSCRWLAFCVLLRSMLRKNNQCET